MKDHNSYLQQAMIVYFNVQFHATSIWYVLGDWQAVYMIRPLLIWAYIIMNQWIIYRPNCTNITSNNNEQILKTEHSGCEFGHNSKLKQVCHWSISCIPLSKEIMEILAEPNISQVITFSGTSSPTIFAFQITQNIKDKEVL